ncbi:Uma2 family endonuclease [Planosporangium thailandense]|uniref:Uma2 family endonuclease n=1 Tax=Planosporangium thailandense TaxID=765197 RepID=A0ABX0XY18_9ACTN|nr:Uma2 family endonuclease [Planosporangium thailandense]NJC70088.1 Uma2 family endonuclease [Planosporangium thailandense]
MTSPTDWADPPPAGWTAEDLRRLAPSGHRRELIDGVVLVEPAPGPFHEAVGALLGTRMGVLCPPGHSVTQGVTVRFGDQRCFIPDVAVVIGDRCVDPSRWLVPREILIAIEVVAPTSLLMDRITKPALYAAAGIPYYWRVETDGGIEVSTYRLDLVEEVYRLTGEFRNTIDVPVPWPIKIPIDEITP